MRYNIGQSVIDPVHDCKATVIAIAKNGKYVLEHDNDSYVNSHTEEQLDARNTLIKDEMTVDEICKALGRDIKIIK